MSVAITILVGSDTGVVVLLPMAVLEVVSSRQCTADVGWSKFSGGRWFGPARSGVGIPFFFFLEGGGRGVW